MNLLTMSNDTGETAKQLFLEALEASSPSRLIQKNVRCSGGTLSIEGQKEFVLDAGQPVCVIAVGKAAVPMGQALQRELDVEDERMLCISPHPDLSYAVQASHPVPDSKSRMAAEKLLAFIGDIPDGALVLFALSGGASALICRPSGALSVEDVNTVNRLLLNSGADIAEMNSVRKHLSAVKGGQLLHHFPTGCTLIDLVISDVPGDRLEIIGSGPTTPDGSTFRGAYEVLQRYELWERVPGAVRHHIEQGLEGHRTETVKPGRDPLENHFSYIIGSARKFAGRVIKAAESRGYRPWIAANAYNKPAREVAAEAGDRVRRAYADRDDGPSEVLVFYGESTVQVTGGGKGGRNQELALRGALEIEGMEGVTWLSAGTDGVDGPTDAAGAVVDGQTVTRAREQGLEPETFLRDNDSYHFHEQMGTLFKTGPTGNNVMDVIVVIISK